MISHDSNRPALKLTAMGKAGNAIVFSKFRDRSADLFNDTGVIATDYSPCVRDEINMHPICRVQSHGSDFDDNAVVIELG